MEDVSELLTTKLKEHVTAAKEALNAMHKRLIAKTVEQRRRSRKRSAKSEARGKPVYMPRVNVGDLVLISLPEQRKHKLEFNWRGPYQVLRPTQTDTWTMSAHGVDDDDEYREPFRGHLRLARRVEAAGAVLMVGALAMHAKVGDPPIKSLPALLMLLMSTTLCFVP